MSIVVANTEKSRTLSYFDHVKGKENILDSISNIMEDYL